MHRKTSLQSHRVLTKLPDSRFAASCCPPGHPNPSALLGHEVPIAFIYLQWAAIGHWWYCRYHCHAVPCQRSLVAGRGALHKNKASGCLPKVVVIVISSHSHPCRVSRCQAAVHCWRLLLQRFQLRSRCAALLLLLLAHCPCCCSLCCLQLRCPCSATPAGGRCGPLLPLLLFACALLPSPRCREARCSPPAAAAAASTLLQRDAILLI